MQRASPHQSSVPFWLAPSHAFPSVEMIGSLWSLPHMQSAAIETTLRSQIEALKFLQNRLNGDLRGLEDCRSPDQQDDLFDIWCTYWQDALLDYVSAGARFAEIGSTSIRKAASRLHDDEKRLVENMAAEVVL